MIRRVALLAAALVVAAGAPRGALTDDDVHYVYGQNAEGKLSVNGTVLDDLPGDFQVTEFGIYYPDEAWSAIALDGQRRYSLRRDGVVRNDGSKLHELPYDAKLTSYWVSLAVSGGVTWSLRQDGLVCEGADTLVKLPTDLFLFRGIVASAGHVWSLRSDGSIFRDDDVTPLYQLRGGPGRATLFPDGVAFDTEWVAMVLDPTEPYVYAIRVDGIVRRADVSDPAPIRPEGEGVAALPFYFDVDADDDGYYDVYPLLDDAYLDIEFKDKGVWLAIAGDGRVYSSKNTTSPVIDFPGDAFDLDDAFTDLATSGNAFWAVRSDGFAYRGDVDAPRVTLPPGHYGRIAASSSPPTLGDADEHPPKCLVYTTRTVVGTPLDVPVVANDIETPSEDLVVTPTSLPSDSSGSSATWDSAARVMRWHSPQVPGTYKFEFKVDDGSSISRFKFTLKVFAADTDPAKDEPPTVPALQGARPIIGEPFSFTVITDDEDGDPVAVSVNTSNYPFDSGATFDPVTRRFAWTPATADQGNRTVKFKVQSGTKEKTLTVKLSVRQGFWF